MPSIRVGAPRAGPTERDAADALGGVSRRAAGRAPLKPYEYSRFCDLYARWKKSLGLVMRQVHRAGEKVFIDYSGKKPRICRSRDGRGHRGRALRRGPGRDRNYTYAEATLTQRLEDFCAGLTIPSCGPYAVCMRAFPLLALMLALPATGCPRKLREICRWTVPRLLPTNVGLDRRSGIRAFSSPTARAAVAAPVRRRRNVRGGAFPPGAAVGENLGPCGLLKMEAQASRVRSVHNLRGTATLSCQTPQHQVSGQVEFANCH